MLSDVAVDGGLKVDDRAKDATADAPAGESREEGFHRVEPGRRGRREVEDPSRMAGQPSAHLGVFVGGVVVEDDMDVHVLRRPAPIADNRGQSRAVLGSYNQADILRQGRRIARPHALVKLVFVAVQ